MKYSKLDGTSPFLTTPSYQDGIPDQELLKRNENIHQNYTTTTIPIQQPDPCSKNLNRQILYTSKQFKTISPIDIKFSDSYESKQFQKTFPSDTSVSNLYIDERIKKSSEGDISISNVCKGEQIKKSSKGDIRISNVCKGEQIKKSSIGDGSVRISNSNKDAQSSSGVDSKWGRYIKTYTIPGSELKDDNDDEFDVIENKYCYKDDQESSDNDNVGTSIYCEDSITQSPKMTEFQTLKYCEYNHPEQRPQSTSLNYQQGKPNNLVEKIAMENHRNQSSIGIQTTKDKMTPVSRKSNVMNVRQKENSDSKWSQFLNQHRDEDALIDLEESDNVESRVVALGSYHDRISMQKNVKSQELAGGYKLSAEVMFENDSESTGDRFEEAKKIHFKDTTSDINEEVTLLAKTRFGYSDRPKESERKSSPTSRIPQRYIKENISVFSAGELTEDDFDL